MSSTTGVELESSTRSDQPNWPPEHLWSAPQLTPPSAQKSVPSSEASTPVKPPSVPIAAQSSPAAFGVTQWLLPVSPVRHLSVPEQSESCAHVALAPASVAWHCTSSVHSAGTHWVPS